MEDIEIRIKAIVEGEDGPKTLAGQLKELKKLANEVGEENVEAYSKVATEIANVEDRVDDLKDTIKTVKGEPIERLGNSFRGLKDSILNMDLKMVKTNFKGIVSSTKDLTTSIGAMIPGLAGATKGMQAFGGAVAATGIGALILGLIALITHFDELKESTGTLGRILGNIQGIIAGYVKDMTDLSDAIGLTNIAAIKLADEGLEKINKAIEDINDGEEVYLEYLEKSGSSEKTLYENRVKYSQAREAQLNKELDIIKEKANINGRLSKEEQEQQAEISKKIGDEQTKRLIYKLDYDKKIKEANDKSNAEEIKKNQEKNKKINEDNLKARKEIEDMEVSLIEDTGARAIAQAKLNRQRQIDEVNKSTLSADLKSQKLLLIEKVYQSQLKNIADKAAEEEAARKQKEVDETEAKTKKNAEEYAKQVEKRKELEDKAAEERKKKEEEEEARRKSILQGQLEDTKNMLSQMNAITSGFLDSTNQAASNLVNIIGDSLSNVLFTIADESATVTDKINASLGAVSSILSGIMQMQQANTDQQIQNIENQSNADIAAQDMKLKNGTITEAQYEANVKKIKDDARKKELAAKKKAFEQEKAMKIVQAVISTAQAVISAFASGGNPIVGAIFAAIAGAVGAAQIAIISSQKFPEGGGSAGGGGGSPSLGGVGGGGGGASMPGSTSISQPTPSAPSFFGLGQNNLLNSQSQKVFVVESDITNTQDRVAKVRVRSVLGG